MSRTGHYVKHSQYIYDDLSAITYTIKQHCGHCNDFNVFSI